MKLISFLMALFFLVTGIHAQTIQGKLVDNRQQAIEYANIVLQQTDSTFVKGVTSDGKGKFRFDKVTQGDYRLVISNIGFQTLYIDLQGFHRSTDLGTLVMEEVSQQLGEVSVTASNVISSADKKMVFPNQKQVNASANGVDLLRNLMIPTLQVNPIANSIQTTDGGSVQLCINGRKASQNEVTALQPSEILRVEMEEDPGVRYGDAAMVINYVVRRYEMGGSLGYNGRQSVKSLFGRHNANGKLNFGKSEISFFYNAENQIFDEMWSVRNETFLFEDGKAYHRVMKTDPHNMKTLTYNGGLTYNLQDGNNYMLNVSFGLQNQNRPNYVEKGELFTWEYPNSVTMREDWKHIRNTSPYLDVYFQKNLKNKQFLAINAVGTYIDTYNRSRYQEFLNDETIVDYYSAVKGKKYSLITEGIYEKGFEHGGKFTSGIKHTQSYTDNGYEGTLNYQTQMRQANTYGYAQYRGKVGKLSYRLGMGVTRSWFKQEGQEDYETWSLNPQFNLNYTFNKHWSTSLTGGLNTGHPSLSQLSAVEQLTDSLQISRGNPLLKPYDSWNSNFRLNYNKGKVNIGFFGKYNHRENPIMPYIYRENDKFIHSYANHDRFQNLNVGMNVRVGMLWDILQLSGSISNDTRWSRGINYNHHHNSLGWSLEAAMLYKKFVFSACYQKNTDYLFGENFTTGEVIHYIALQYRIKKLNVGLMMLNPFEDDYCRNENNLNQYAGNTFEYHIDDSARMIWATLSWNFSFGRDYKSGSKRMNNSDTDSGVM